MQEDAMVMVQLKISCFAANANLVSGCFLYTLNGWRDFQHLKDFVVVEGF